MKKIININLSGRVIPIEDSAYEKLQVYIESLRRYFAKEEGRDEIINDIESRIAELMNEKVRKSSSAVTDSDIEEIINAMGRAEDFDAADVGETFTGANMGAGFDQSSARERKRRLYRDASDKIIGGVCSGIANAINVDPAIVRILFVLVTFGGFGLGVLLYLLMWIILPLRPLETYIGKRLFRNPDDKVISGVAGGLGAYFNFPSWVIRLVFVAPLLLNVLLSILDGVFLGWEGEVFPNFFIGSFTGTFALAYIILWIVLPEARSPFEKMEMRGEKVDVNTIRQNVQSDFKGRMESFGNEVKDLGMRAKNFANTRGKDFVNEVGETAKPLSRGIGHVIGVLFKAFFIFVIAIIVLALFAVFMAMVFGGIVWWPINAFIWTSSMQQVLFWGTLIFFIGVPVIGLMTWLIRRVARVRSRSAYLGWTFGGLWVVGWICVVAFATTVARDLSEFERVDENLNIAQPANNKIIVNVFEPEIRYSKHVWWMDVDDKGWAIEGDTMKYDNVKIRVIKSEDSLYHAKVYKYSAGRNIDDARERASSIVFRTFMQDSVLNMASGLHVASDDKFRGQGVIMEIQVPVGKKIRFDESISRTFSPWVLRRSEHRYGGWRTRDRYSLDWDYDYHFSWKPNVDYIMLETGAIEDPLNPKKEESKEYEYSEPDEREQRRRRIEELRRLEEQERADSIRNSQSLKSNKIQDDNAGMYLKSPVFSLIPTII